MAGMVDGDYAEKLPVCPIIFEWTHLVPDFTTPTVYTTEEEHFLCGCNLPRPFISPSSPSYSQDLPTPELESDGNLGSGICQGLWTKRRPHNGTPF